MVTKKIFGLCRQFASSLTLVCAFFLSPAGAAQPAWQSEWEKVLQAARKEGMVVVYGPSGEEMLYQEFRNRYPGIGVSYIPGGAEREYKILSERRAGKFLGDVYIGGRDPLYSVEYKGGILDPIKDALILPEVLDESKWWGKSHLYLDDDKKFIFAFNEVVQNYFHYNTKAVDPSQFSSYWDLVNPKWKGKMLLWEPLQPGTDGVLRFFYFHPELGPKYITRLLEMGAVETRDLRQFVDWLAAGRYPIAGLQGPDRSGLSRAKEQGLPIDWFDSRKFKEGAPLSTGGGNIALLNRPAHPNASKVFINWLLSREGQITYQTIKRTSGARNSLRTDIPKDTVPSYAKPLEGGKYWRLSNPEFSDIATVAKFVKQLREKR